MRYLVLWILFADLVTPYDRPSCKNSIWIGFCLSDHRASRLNKSYRAISI